MRSLVLLICGSILGIGLVVACSDDTPGNADAAACDCDPAEAPLAGREVRVSSAALTIQPSSDGGTLASCPSNATLVTGGCYIDDDQTGRQLMLKGFGPIGPGQQTLNGWGCDYNNNSTVGAAVVHAEAVCRNPAP